YPALYPIPRWLSLQCLGRFEARRVARHSLCWMLLGVDDVVVRWWRDQHVMDGSYCDPRTSGENRQRALRVAHSRSWPYNWGLVADAAYVLCRSFADNRRRPVRRRDRTTGATEGGHHRNRYATRGLCRRPEILSAVVEGARPLSRP